MGNHVSILRTKEGRSDPILRDEVAGLLASRDGLRVAREDGDVCEITTVGGEPGPLLVWQDGEIWAKNPDRDTLALMLDIAGALDARVRGDDLETYSSPDEHFVHPDDRVALEEAERRHAGMRYTLRRRRRISRAVVFAVFAVLGFILHYCSRVGAST